MSDDEFKSFKISAKVPNAVDRKGPKETASAPVESTSVGFPTIEALLEQDEIDLGSFGARHAQLTEIAAGTGDNRTKANAKKAAIAYERTHDLLEYLLSTKDDLKTDGGAPSGEGA